MAIPFLNNINLSDNQLLNAKLQVTGTAPTAAPGQIYFDSSGNVAQYHDNTVWVRIRDTTLTAGTFVSAASSGSGSSLNYTVDLSAGGTPSATTYLRGDNSWEPISGIPGTYTWTVSDGSNSTLVASGETVTFSGTANEIEVAESSRTVTIGLPNDVTIANNLTVGGTGNFTGQVTIPILPVASTDAASKDYVDNAVVGGLVYQGGYDAATNTPDLTTSPNSILKGWTYTVTADGTFFGEQLRVGDVLIAEVNDPSALTDWTTVQNNIDLADLTTVGIGNVNAGDAIDVSYSSGTATVSAEDSTASNKGVVIVSKETGGEHRGVYVNYDAPGEVSIGLDIDTIPEDATPPMDESVMVYHDEQTGENYSIQISDLLALASGQTSYATTITDTATISHGLASSDVMVQLYDITTGETVYADVDRISTTQVTITFAATPTNSVRVLVQKIG